MLAVGSPLIATTAATTTTLPIINFITSPPSSSPSPLLEGVGVGNLTLEMPQGDQPPVPPLKGGTPKRPGHWDKSTRRLHYVKNRYGKYLAMSHHGRMEGVPENNSLCVFVLMSHVANVVMRSYVSDLYLCMNSTSYDLYTRKDVHDDCMMVEEIRNGTGNLVYSFKDCLTPGGKRCYLGMYRNGTMRRGHEARQSQRTAQWLQIEVHQEDIEVAERERKDWLENPTRTPAPALTTTRRPVSQREQRRKRMRGWCRNMDLIVRRPEKHLRPKRCHPDCDVLRRMVAKPERAMRRCLQYHVRRHLRKKKKKTATPPALLEGDADSPEGSAAAAEAAKTERAKIRARMQILWPRRREVFQRLRQLHRCNKKLREQQRKHGSGDRKDGEKRSCSQRQVRHQLAVRAKHRRQAKAHHSSSLPASPSSSSSSSHTRPRPGARRVRHRRKRTGGGREGRRRDSDRRRESDRRDSGKRDIEKRESEKRDSEMRESEKRESEKSDSEKRDSGGKRGSEKTDGGIRDAGAAAAADVVEVRRQKRRTERSVLWTALTVR